MVQRSFQSDQEAFQKQSGVCSIGLILSSEWDGDVQLKGEIDEKKILKTPSKKKT